MILPSRSAHPMHLYLIFSSLRSAGKPTQVWWYHISQKSQQIMIELPFSGCLQMQNKSWSLVVWTWRLSSNGLILRIVLANIFQMVAISLRDSSSSIKFLLANSVISIVSFMCFFNWSRLIVFELLKIWDVVLFQSWVSFWWTCKSTYSLSLSSRDSPSLRSSSICSLPPLGSNYSFLLNSS